MKMDKMMCGSRELEFAIFCIENIASRLHVDAQKVYVALSEQTNILKDYIIPEYEVLHTQSKDYIVDDIIDVMHERGVKL
jgi:GTP:adenosylcobinamide-phosphate guanylyltransferase